MTHIAMRCREHGIERRFTKPNHPWTNGQVERMNRTIKDAAVKRFPYDGHEQLRRHLADFIAAYDYGADPRPSRDLRPTKTSADGGQTNPNASPSTRSSKCRDQTPRVLSV